MRRTVPLDRERAARTYQHRRAARARAAAAATATKPRSALTRKPRPRLPRRLFDLQARLRKRWAERARGGVCAVCNRVDCGPVHGHHAIPRQQLIRLCRDLGYDQEQTIRVMWDLRNLMRAGQRCHDNHHHGVRQIPRAAVIAACPKLPQFLAELDAGWLLDRTYTS